MVFSYIFIFGFFIKWFKENRKDKKEYLKDVKKQLDNCFVNIDMDVDEQFYKKYSLYLNTTKHCYHARKYGI